jgi:hypothetical protein
MLLDNCDSLLVFLPQHEATLPPSNTQEIAAAPDPFVLRCSIHRRAGTADIDEFARLIHTPPPILNGG